MGDFGEVEKPRREVFLRHEVFVVGGQPTVTYNPRPTQGIDQRVRDYLDERGRILCITGPTKSGKTVLVRQVVPDALRLSGGEIASIHDFWKDISDELSEWTERILEQGGSEDLTEADQLNATLKVFGSGAGASKESSRGKSRTEQQTEIRKRDPRRAAKAALLRLKPPIVLDDFHHIEPAVQQQIIRGVKDLVFERVPVILVAVPHRAADVVRAEREMQGRVETLQIQLWLESELEAIAGAGFAALNVDCDLELAKRLARESYGSPHLMQDFCLRICKNNDIKETVDRQLILKDPSPEDTKDFFRDAARREPFDDTHRRLAQGPRQRTDRKPRKLKDGTTTDIYGVVLEAITSTGPKTQLNWTEIRNSLRKVMLDEPPSRGEYTRVLEQMSEIARKAVWDEKNQRYVGDPVLELDSELGILHISDPFFAYQLRWGVRISDGSPEGAT
ncbi:MAG: hypothetical protein ACTHN3_06970 [Solirubrobacterales bacterium]